MRSLFAFLATALTTLVVRTWNGFQWVCRTITGTHPLPIDVTPAEAAADAVVEAHRAAVATDAPAAASPVRMPGYPLAVLAKEYLRGVEANWVTMPSLDALSPEAQAWLTSLSEKDAEQVRDRTLLYELNRHLAGGETIYGLSPILSMDELISKAEEKRRSEQYVIDILQSLTDDDEQALKAA